jgi:hypothetical protein
MLKWKTYYELPQLRSYAAALKHFNDVIPIRGDANGTKPAGRRDQKWLSIYKRETDNAVCIGSMWNKEKALLAYYPDGRVVIEQGIGVSCRERIQRIAGLNIQRRHNEDWVAAAAHVDGSEVVGHYPLKLKYNSDRKAVFILRENATAIYLNPVPVYKHTINRKVKAELTARYKPFLNYVEAMAKLSADPTQFSKWDKESMDNPRIPMVTLDQRDALGIPNKHLYTRYNNHQDTLRQFLTLVDSGDTENWYKAMVWLQVGYWKLLLNEAKTSFMHVVHRHNRDALFTKVRASAGELVYDRYAMYFR